MDTTALQHHVRSLLEPAISRLGYDLVAVEWLGGSQGRILRLSIEQSTGIDAEDCSKVANYVSPLLDEADPVEGSYHLEVSSPGIDRPLQRGADFARFAGYRAKIKLVDGHPRRRYTGTLRGIVEEVVHIEVDGVVHPVSLEAIERAHLVLTLDEYQQLAEVPHDAQ